MVFRIFSISLFFLSSCSSWRLLNSGTVHLKYRESEGTFKGLSYGEKERIGKPSVSVRNVQNPLFYQDWDLNMKFTPSLHYDNILYESSDNYPEIKIIRGIGMGNAKLSFHTPVGALTAAIGYGLSLQKFNDGAGDISNRARLIRKLDFTYTAFLGKRFFFLVGPRYYKTNYRSFILAFRLGYYWGSLYQKR